MDNFVKIHSVNEATCFKCLESKQTINRFSIQSLKVHLSTSHRNDPGNYKCGEYDCSREFGDDWGALRRHLVSFHKVGNSSEPSISVNILENCHEFENEEQSAYMPENALDDSELDKGAGFSMNIEKSLNVILMSFLGKLYANPNLPRIHVQHMVLELMNLFEVVFSMCKESLGPDMNSEQNCVLTIIQSVIRTLKGLGTEKLRLKAIKSSGFYIEPESYQVGRRVSERRVNDRIINVTSKLEGQYIDIRKTLKCFFSMPNVLKDTLSYMKDLEGQEGVLGNFVQGMLWRAKREQYFKDKTVIPLFFYYDDFEVSNPLGSHAGIQKLGGTYFSIPCLPAEYSSRLENIFLALLTYASDRHSTDTTLCRNKKVFGHLINDINSLQRHGIVFKDSKGDLQTIYFAFGLLLGDNEGLNSIQDFVEGFSANYFCRTCRAHRTNTQRDTVEKPELLRTEDSYEEDVAGPAKETGIKARSVWNLIEGHHIYRNSVADLLHDLQEGVIKYAMYQIVYHFVKVANKKLELSVLNDRIRLFDYYMNGFSNRPPLISEDDLVKEKRLKMSGSEMLNFCLTFAMLVGDVIKMDKVWTYYLLLRKIIDIAYAPCIQVDCSYLLDDLVAEHNELYMQLFNETLKPKFHFLVHFGRIMRDSGPLIHLSSMRFEGYHRPNKQRGVATQSRINLLKTISIKQQLQSCYRFLSNTGLEHGFDIGPPEPSDPGDAPAELPNTLGKEYVQVPWVKYKGTLYKVGMVVVTGEEENSLPIFGTICNVYCNEKNQICFICQSYYTFGLDETLHAYEVQKTNSYTAVLASDLLMYKPVILASLTTGNAYVTLRYAL